MTRREGRTLYTVLALAVATLLMVDSARAEITAIYPKKVCEKTSQGKVRNGGFLKNKMLLWGAVSFGWCERRSGKYQGAVVSFTGPLTQVGITSWGRKNSWGYEGESKRLVKCVNKGPWGCSYLRVKIWHEFDQDITAWPFKQASHTMKFSLLVGNGLENWR